MRRLLIKWDCVLNFTTSAGSESAANGYERQVVAQRSELIGIGDVRILNNCPGITDTMVYQGNRPHSVAWPVSRVVLDGEENKGLLGTVPQGQGF